MTDDARLEGAVASAAEAMKAHPNWGKPGWVKTYEDIDIENHRHDLEDAINFFKKHDPEYLCHVANMILAATD